MYIPFHVTNFIIKSPKDILCNHREDYKICFRFSLAVLKHLLLIRDVALNNLIVKLAEINLIYAMSLLKALISKQSFVKSI